MTEETREQRKRRQARARKQAQRERERQHREVVGAAEFRMEMYAGTRDALQQICTAWKFDDPAEAITLLIHNVAELAERDPSRFAELLRVRCHA